MKKVNEVANKLNITIRTLHYYDDIGLIVPTRKNGIRLYSNEDIEKIRKVLMFKELGFNLKDIASIIDNTFDFELLKIKRDELIEKRNNIDEIISLIDTLVISKSKIDSHKTVSNPFGPFIRKKLGDDSLNYTLDHTDFDSNIYIKKVSEIFERIRINIDDSKVIKSLLEEYYDYFVNWLNVKVSRDEFSNIIIEKIFSFDNLDAEEKTKLTKHFRNF